MGKSSRGIREQRDHWRSRSHIPIGWRCSSNRGSEAGRSLARLRLTAADADDVLQRVRTKLLVGDGQSPPRLASYAARGSLIGWVRASVVHEALSAKRADGRRGPHDGASALDRMPGEDPDLGRLRELYAVPFKAAFAEVLASLTPRDRNVLRLVYMDGLTAEQVGAVYGVHRVSVARWIGQVRHALFERTRALLCERLHLQSGEVESITRLCLSQIDVSLDRLLLES